MTSLQRLSGGASDTYTLCVDLSTCIDVTYSAGSYSAENSWSISDASGAVLASGGNVSGQIGVCAISGCTDSTATNYNALATIDDGSCIAPCTDNAVVMTLTSFAYQDGAYGMVYTITDASGLTVATGSGTAGSWASDDTDLCLPTGCYDLAVSSAFCCNTSYGWAFMGLSGDAGTISANISIGGATCAILGCTDSLATNYMLLATIDDGSCIYLVYWMRFNYYYFMIHLVVEHELGDSVNGAAFNCASGYGIVFDLILTLCDIDLIILA